MWIQIHYQRSMLTYTSPLPLLRFSHSLSLTHSSRNHALHSINRCRARELPLIMDPAKKRKQPDSAFNEDPNSGDGAVSKREGDLQDLRFNDRNAIGQGSQKIHSAETPVIKATAEMVEGLGFFKQATSEEQPLAGPSSEGSTTLPPDQQQPQLQQQQSGPSEHYKEFVEEALEVLKNTY